MGMSLFRLQADTPDFIQALREVEMDAQEKIRRLLEMVGIETVAFLRSLTTTMRPPVRKGEGARQAHPGGWADVTGNLANAYAWRVEQVNGGWALVLTNHMEYAVYLEAKDGYFVLGGILDKGGPVDQALRRIVAGAFPGWTVGYAT